MLQHFSSMMLEMYELAERLAWDDYLAACLALVGRAIRFDIAALGCGAVRERRKTPLTCDPDPRVLSSSFHLNLPPPIVCTTTRLQQFFDESRLQSYVQRHGVRQLLLAGSAEPLPMQQPPRWLLLGRHGHQAFSVGSAVYLSAI